MVMLLRPHIYAIWNFMRVQLRPLKLTTQKHFLYSKGIFFLFFYFDFEFLEKANILFNIVQIAKTVTVFKIQIVHANV